MRKYFLIAASFWFVACTNSQRPGKTLPHYDLDKPQTFVMPPELREISGFVLMPGSSNLVLAEQDEEGKVYLVTLGDKKATHLKFGNKGDFEDISIWQNTVYMLRSDGSLFSFPLSQVRAGKITDVNTWDALLPKGEYEGMFADPATQKLYVLCKQCSGQTNKTGAGTVFSIQSDGSIRPDGDFRVEIAELEKFSARKKAGFQPSALARNPSTGEWFILSSVNSLLVVTGADWKVKDIYPLDRTLFNQPEGIAFDAQNNLYISNEGGTGNGTILKFAYRK